MDIIIKDIKPKGCTRSSTDRDLQESWGTTSFRNEEDKDKAEFIERKLKKEHNADNSRVTARIISQIE